MTTLSKLFDLRKSLIEFEENLGLSNLSDLEKAMLEFIGNQAVDNATLTDIIQNEYFKNYSLSTIKRGGVGHEIELISTTCRPIKNDIISWYRKLVQNLIFLTIYQ